MSALLNLIQFVAVMESTIQIYVNWRKPNAWGTQTCIKYLMERVLHNDQGGSCNTYYLFSLCIKIIETFKKYDLSIHK